MKSWNLLAGLVLISSGCKMMAPHEAGVSQRPAMSLETAEKAIESSDRLYYKGQEAFLPKFAQATQIGSRSTNAASSPLSAYLMFSILINGSQNSTFDLCAKILNLEDPRIERMNRANSKILDILSSQPSQPVKLATGIFNILPLRFNRDFQSDMAKFYDAQVTKLGSAGEGALKVLNDWGADRMGKDFPPAYGDIDPKTETIALNLVSLNVAPAQPFDAISRSSFLTPSGSIDASYLVSANHVAALSKVGSIQLCTIELSAPNLLLTVVLPDKKEMVSSGLSAEVFRTAFANKTMTKQAIAIPQFSVNQTISLNEATKRLGGAALFASGNDFSIMSHDMKSSSGISTLIQKCKFAMNSSTESKKVATSKIEEATFRADRPFIYFVWEKDTNSVLILGAIQDPTQP